MDVDRAVRDIALRITGTLDIDEVLVTIRSSLSEWMPVDEILLYRLAGEELGFHLISRVNGNGVGIHDPGVLFELQGDEREMGRNRLLETESSSLVFTLADFSREGLHVDWVARMAVLELNPESDCIVLLNVELRAGLVVVSHRPNVYCRKHVELFESLQESFRVALVNATQFRDLQQKRDALADDNQLFRDVTVCLTGESDIGKAFRDTIECVRGVLPISWILLVTTDVEADAQRVLLRVSHDGTISETEELVFLGVDTRGIERRRKMLDELPDTFVKDLNDAEFVKMVGADNPRKNMARMGIDPDAYIVVLAVKAVHAAITFIFETKPEIPTQYLDIIHMLKAPFVIAVHNAVRFFELQWTKKRLLDENRALHNDMQKEVGGRVIGMHHGLRQVMSMAGQVAKTQSPVLLLGETGSGKEVIATAVHRFSNSSGGPFVSINCGAIPETLIDSELFGHEKGAFTGASERKLGRFERADGGTLFLDEVGELPPSAQVKLLRVLQEKEFERIGGNHVIRADVRLIAATNRDLPAMVRNGAFREDLWFRLNVFPIEIPPLRERREDIAPLVYYFIESKSRELNLPTRPSLPAVELDRLQQYDWPGNVRELQNAIERALILSRGEPLRFPFLESVLADDGRTNAVRGITDGAAVQPFDQMAAAYFRHLLQITGGRISGPNGAARLAGMNASTLRSKLKKLGIA